MSLPHLSRRAGTLWLVASLCLAVCPRAGFAFEGRVVGEDGTGVVGAAVAILGHPGTATTDEDGRFRWSPDPPPPFEVIVILPDGTYGVPVLVERLAAGELTTLQVRPMVSESVTVVGGAAPTIRRSPAGATVTLSREEMATRQPVRLTETLENVAGAGRLSDLHAGVPSLRGLARGRTLVLLDGARVTTERVLGPGASFLDPFFLDGVEVARGPGAVGYGSDAFGGVIHARTRRVAPGSPTQVRFSGALGAGLPQHNVGTEVSHGFDRGALLVQARYRRFDAYRSPDGDVPNSQATDHGILARVSHTAGPGLLTLGGQTDRVRDMGRPDSRGDAVRTTHPEESSQRLTASYHLPATAGFSRVGFEGFWGQYDVVTERETTATRRAPGTVRRSDVRARDFSFRGFVERPVRRARWEAGVDVSGRYGLESAISTRVERPDGSAVVTDERAVDSARRLDVGLFTSTDVTVASRVLVGAGARVDRVTSVNRGGALGDRQTANAALSGYGSATVTLATGLTLTTQIARGFRDPTLTDRYFVGLGGRGIVRGNPELEPETSRQLDVALRFVREGVRWALYAYHYRISDLVERIELMPDLFTFVNRGEVDLSGFEVETQARLPSAFILDVSAGVARGRTADTNAPTNDIPAHRLVATLRRALANRGYVQARVAAYAAADDPGPTEIATPGYALVDLGTGWRFADHLELRVVARNLFDRAHPISRDPRAVLAPGRSVVVTVVASASARRP